MTKELWINLPVKDLRKSKAFFKEIGFSINDREMEDMVGMSVGEKEIAVMLCAEKRFKMFAQNNITDTGNSSEAMFSFDAESRDEVDEWAKKVEKAGGDVFAEPEEIQGWMYGCAFTDLDGHRWNVLYMDQNKM
jgi:predicted lactoylglutathione lyase